MMIWIQCSMTIINIATENKRNRVNRYRYDYKIDSTPLQIVLETETSLKRDSIWRGIEMQLSRLQFSEVWAVFFKD